MVKNILFENRKNLLSIFLVMFSTAVYFWTSTIGLYEDVINPDGINWHVRSQNFINALARGKLGDTFQAYHPGTTLMWISGPVLKLVANDVNHKGGIPYSKETFLILDYAAKLSLVVFVTSIQLLTTIMLIKVFDLKTALIFSVIFTLEPFVIGMRRLYHLDFLMTSLVFLSFVFILYHIIKFQNILSLVFAGVLYSLALLTKSTAVISLPIFFMFLVMRKLDVRKLVLFFCVFALSLIFSFYFFFPAVWQKPLGRFPKYLQRIYSGASEIGYKGREELGSSGEFKNIFLDTFIIDKGSNFYFSSLPMRLSTPAVILCVISLIYFSAFFVYRHVFLWLKFFSRKGKKPVFLDQKVTVFLWSFLICIVYIVVFTLSTKKIDRYLIVIFPFLILIVSQFLSLISAKITLVLLIFYMFFVCIDLRQIYPYFVAYSNPQLGGVKARFAKLDDSPFGVATYAAFNMVQKDRAWRGESGYYTISGPKSLKAIAWGAKFSRYPSCVSDYLVVSPTGDRPVTICNQHYLKIGVIRVGNMDFWHVYRREAQRHESNYD